MVAYNQLVRDRVPDIITKAGKKVYLKTLSEQELEEALKNKLQVEVQEYLKSDRIEELADILEVVEALAEFRGESMDTIATIKNERREERGGFDKRLLLRRIVESGKKTY
jgi:predicted house-cleaning noncanonical NTP pyrophosphatase (MazG superfamily)